MIERVARRLGRGSRGLVSLVSYPVLFVRQRLFRGHGGPRFSAAQLAADQGLTALSTALADPDPTRRILALEIIARFSEDRATHLLSGVLQDPHPKVRAAAAATAGGLGAPAIVFMLILMLADPDPVVRATARTAIEEITGHRVALDESPSSGSYRRQVDDLKRWWKQRRFVQLAAEAQIRVEPST